MIDLRQGDCLEIMKDIPDKSIDMILCDLPYGTTACKWDVVIPFESLWEQYNRIIKDNGAIVLFSKQPFTTELIHSNLKNFKYSLVWKKDNHDNPLMAKKRFLNITDYPRNILEFKRDLPNIHPTQKPVALLEYLIKTYTNENETVLDNCMGSGSTGVACMNINRNFIGIELDEKYFEIAKERIEKAQNKWEDLD